MPAASPAKAAPDRPRRRLAEVAAVASICGLALVAYWGTWNGSYVFSSGNLKLDLGQVPDSDSANMLDKDAEPTPSEGSTQSTPAPGGK